MHAHKNYTHKPQVQNAKKKFSKVSVNCDLGTKLQNESFSSFPENFVIFDIS